MTIQQNMPRELFVKIFNYRSYEKCRASFILKNKKQKALSFHELWQPVENIFISMPSLEGRGDRPLQLNFEHQLKALVIWSILQGDISCKFSKKTTLLVE